MTPRTKTLITAVALALIGSTAALLDRLESLQRLGQPGLVMVAEPVLAEDGRVVNTNTIALPPQVLDYTSEAGRVMNVELSWLPADTTYARRLYRTPDGQQQLQLNVVLMGTDRGSIHKPQICLTGQGWTITRSDHLSIPLAGPQPYELPVLRLIADRTVRDRSGNEVALKAVYVYWFVADGQVTAQHGERMWWMARDLLTEGVLQRWAYVSCLALCLPGQEEALYEQIQRFLQHAVPTFQKAPIATGTG